MRKEYNCMESVQVYKTALNQCPLNSTNYIRLLHVSHGKMNILEGCSSQFSKVIHIYEGPNGGTLEKPLNKTQCMPPAYNTTLTIVSQFGKCLLVAVSASLLRKGKLSFPLVKGT